MESPPVWSQTRWHCGTIPCGVWLVFNGVSMDGLVTSQCCTVFGHGRRSEPVGLWYHEVWERYKSNAERVGSMIRDPIAKWRCVKKKYMKRSLNDGCDMGRWIYAIQRSTTDAPHLIWTVQHVDLTVDRRHPSSPGTKVGSMKNIHK